ncbi:hypothetical protein K32_02850 [Kaistia sp. 32K]|uniref:glycosyltransferase family 9 protein n=1 Tax=Kaistia sp. 32K TaxID=2795690 RepID=UPI00191642FB|nr:glycosyltransferase family 9 protein [Kaistia sp. 32K]BCP51668.1 hypothetical protein K32_02850 [Kaistia sp. 32K]
MSYVVHRGPDRVIYRSWEAQNAIGSQLRIVALKLDHVGDFWMSLGPLKELRKRFADAHITLVVGSWNIGTARQFDLADDYVAFDFFGRNPRLGERRRIATDIRELLNGPFDLAIDMRVPDDTRSVLLAIEARHHAAIADRYRNPQIDIAIPPGALNLRRKKAYKLLQRAGLSGLLPRRWVDKHADRNQMRIQHIADSLTLLVSKAAAWFYGQIDWMQPPVDDDGPVVVAPFSNSHLRDWPIQNFEELVAALSRTRTVILVGRNEDAAVLQQTARVARERGGGSIDVASNLSEQQFNELLSSASLVISNNSGAGHVAAQLGRPTLGIFTASHLPELWGFQGPRVSILMSAIECRGCGLDVVRRCPEKVRCKNDITAEHVLAEIEALTSNVTQPLIATAA